VTRNSARNLNPAQVLVSAHPATSPGWSNGVLLLVVMTACWLYQSGFMAMTTCHHGVNNRVVLAMAIRFLIAMTIWFYGDDNWVVLADGDDNLVPIAIKTGFYWR
jgi:hypothetical protein